MKTTYAALFVTACFLITAILEKQWRPEQHRAPAPLTAHSDARIASNAEGSPSALSMPCTWICKGSDMRCSRIENRQCVNADRSQ